MPETSGEMDTAHPGSMMGRGAGEPVLTLLSRSLIPGRARQSLTLAVSHESNQFITTALLLTKCFQRHETPVTSKWVLGKGEPGMQKWRPNTNISASRAQGPPGNAGSLALKQAAGCQARPGPRKGRKATPQCPWDTLSTG